jgi:hypothetical protein
MLSKNKIMKSLIFILGFCFLILSCKEVGPSIDLTPVDETLTDTTYFIEGFSEPPQQQKVLIEDFTGVQCVNCPGAHEAIFEIINSNPDDTICVAAIHNYGPGAYPEATEDYEYDEEGNEKIGFEIDNLLGNAFAWPTGIINRKNFTGTGIFTMSSSQYATYVDEELSLTPPCNIYVAKTSFDETTRELIVKVIVKYTSSVDVENHLTIYLTESNLINPQLTETGIDYSYTHNFVVRDALTPVTGVVLDAGLSNGRVFEKEFKYTLADNWVDENIEIIAFVHNFYVDESTDPDTSHYEVLQAGKLKGPF